MICPISCISSMGLNDLIYSMHFIDVFTLFILFDAFLPMGLHDYFI